MFLILSSQDHATLSRKYPSARGTSHGVRSRTKGGDD